MCAKSTISLMLGLIFYLGTGYSQPVSIEKAAEFADGYFSSRSVHLNRNSNDLKILDSQTRQKLSHKLYYIFNFENGGFILVSADQRFYPVLAYSSQGRFDLEDIPENCKSWIDWYEAQIEKAIADGGPFYPDMPLKWETLKYPVSNSDTIDCVMPLLTSSWSQLGNYNQMCPAEPESYNGHVPVGCVALGMAQLMYYYRFPESGNGTMLYTPGYGGGIYGPQYVDYSSSNYNWSSMPDIAHDPSDETAEICYHAGVSVQTSYQPESSGADIHDVPAALRSNFNYLADDYLPRSEVPNVEEWTAKLMNNLNNRQPVLYRSSIGWSGHVYICDGYSDSAHFHFNWGWGGAYNGFFYIDELVPGGINLTFGQGAVFNIYPDTSQFQYPAISQDTTVLTGLSGSFGDGSGPEDYPDNLIRSWLIQPADSGITNIYLVFSMIQTELGSDVIRIYDGNSTDAPLILSVSGDDFPVEVESSGKSMYVTFEADQQGHYNGFHASYYGCHFPFCSGNQWLTDTSGILGDGSRYLDYRNGTDCEWILAPYISPEDSVSAIDLFFNRFDLAPGDTLFIYDGTEHSSPLLGKFYSGNTPYTLVSNVNKVLVHFITDQQYTAGGWEIIWHYIPPEYCKDTAHYYSNQGLLTDGSGDLKYLANTDCYYSINLPGINLIRIEFLEFDLEKDYDYLKFYDADQPQNELAKFSGPDLPGVIWFNLKNLLIYFHSDYRDNFSGWSLSYSTSDTGIPEQGKGISVSPNPANDHVKIESSFSLLSHASYRLFRLDGVTVKTGNLDSSPEYIRLDGLKPGIYCIIIQNGIEIYQYKIMKY